jgi:hypothetical protein
VKNTTKLGIKKVTLRNLDEPTLDAMAGGWTIPTVNAPSCVKTMCATCIIGNTCLDKTCK